MIGYVNVVLVLGYGRDQIQVSPAGSMASGGPPQPPIHTQMGTHHSRSSHGSHSSGSHSSIPQSYPMRPDQNQNVKNGNHFPNHAPPPPVITQAASNKHHEQRLTHEQVDIFF